MRGSVGVHSSAIEALGGAALRPAIAQLEVLLLQLRGVSTVSSGIVANASEIVHAVTLRATHEHVPVGSRLELHLDALPTTITTVTGRPEAVKLFAWAKPAGRGAHKELLRDALDHGVRREGDTVTIWASLKDPSSISSLRVLAVVPPRYFSFDLRSGGGAVAVAAAKEGAEVAVTSSGGPIRGGSLQASVIRLHSGGGSVDVRQLTAAEAHVASHGGAMTVGTLAGLRADLDAGEGGSMHLGAAFIEEHARFRGGRVTADSLRGGMHDGTGGGSGDVKVILDGDAPHLTVGGVDGALQVSCTGAGPAAVDLQINEGCRRAAVEVGPAGAAVTLHVAPTLAAEVELAGCGEGWELPGDGSAAVTSAEQGLLRARLDAECGGEGMPRSRLQRGGESVGGGAATCRLEVTGGGAAVRVRRRSWMEARQQAFRNKLDQEKK